MFPAREDELAPSSRQARRRSCPLTATTRRAERNLKKIADAPGRRQRRHDGGVLDAARVMDAPFLLDEYRARLERSAGGAPLRAGENPYLELMTDARRCAGLSAALDLAERRRELASLFSGRSRTRGLSRFSPRTRRWRMRRWHGVLVRLLRARGVDVLAYDARPGPLVEERVSRGARAPWTKIHRGYLGHGRAPASSSGTLVLCWPLMTTMGASYAVLARLLATRHLHRRARRGRPLGALSARAEAHWTLGRRRSSALARLRDTLMIYRRNVERRPISSA